MGQQRKTSNDANAADQSPFFSNGGKHKVRMYNRYEVGGTQANALPDDVLLLGSGGSVHNLGDLEWQSRDGSATDWARAFADWLSGHLASGDIDALLDWEHQAPNARHAHPTTEHLMPLFVALGAAGRQFRSEPLHRDFEFGSLAMQAFAFRSAA